MRKAALHNLGCKVNSYETEAMQQLLEDAGYQIVPFGEQADVSIINTCSVTNIADRKSRQMLHKAKKISPYGIVVAVGCYVQAAKKELEGDGAVDLVVGNNKKTELVRILEEYFQQGQALWEDNVLDMAQARDYENLRLGRAVGHARAFIKVQDGCNQFCSYCIIPFTRGRVRSRKPLEVVQEVEGLVARGYEEVVLTGIHLSSYGLDFPEEERTGLLGLAALLNQVEGLRRIRLGSLEPRIVTEEFARGLAGLKKACPHFHLSLQSGCDATLKRMNRHYDARTYLEKCQLLRQFYQDPAITTDVIVGFPGETEEEFEETKAFLSQVGFYEIHVFKYSKRAGTKAADMPGQVPEQVKAQRSSQLLALGRQLSFQYQERFLGREAQVLLEEKLVIDGIPYMAGHTREYIKAVVPYAKGRERGLTTGILTSMAGGEALFLKET